MQKTHLFIFQKCTFYFLHIVNFVTKKGLKTGSFSAKKRIFLIKKREEKKSHRI
ncbi:MAG: hypothetical protein CNLJKLNK_00858 [Holosporales bacterium]